MSIPIATPRPGGPEYRVMGERGSMIPLLAIVMLGFALTVIVIVATSSHAVRVARAEWAADAAALALAAVGPEAGGAGVARTVAEANGATVVGISTGWSRHERNPNSDHATGIAPVVVVRVDYAGVRAESAAQRFTSRNPWSGS